MIKELIKLANHLDSKGLVKEADYLDNLVKNAGVIGWLKSFLPNERSRINKWQASEYAMLEDPEGFDPYAKSVEDKISFLRQLKTLHDNAPDSEKDIYQSAIAKYVNSPQHKPRTDGTPEQNYQSAKDSYDFYRAAKSDNEISLVQFGLVSPISKAIDATAIALKRLAIDRRVSQTDAYSLENQQDKVDRAGNPVT